MRFSVFTASTPEWEPAEAARIIAAQGWDGIEWRITDQEESETPGHWAGNRATWPLTGLEESLPEIARITHEAGLALSALGGYAQVSDRENVERLLAATAALGAERVRVNLPHVPTPDYRATFAAARADLEWVVERAAAHGVQALIELHHGTIVSSASAAYRLVEGLDPKHVGVIHDIGNLIHEGFEDLPSAFQILGEYLAHVHVKNAMHWPNNGMPGIDGQGRWDVAWASLRDGQADIDWLFRALVAVGYDGWITLEDFVEHNRPREERLADSLEFLHGSYQRAQMWAEWVAAGSPEGDDLAAFAETAQHTWPELGDAADDAGEAGAPEQA
ncbi:MAG: sugar phosphate isomerase/epimerase [Microbacteriaceae bacterium]|nr:sugar phosphate isomerase/epimerase [Microbacteriaceae bacterium]MCL2796243.1 sugar phosphate isomerase/epimerase [Microbacteriaceae bacterium]